MTVGLRHYDFVAFNSQRSDKPPVGQNCNHMQAQVSPACGQAEVRVWTDLGGVYVEEVPVFELESWSFAP